MALNISIFVFIFVFNSGYDVINYSSKVLSMYNIGVISYSKNS